MYERECLRKGAELTLKKRNSGDIQTFYISEDKPIGEGSSTLAYKAFYKDGPDKYFCIIKELYPKGCGLKRDSERGGVHIVFDETEPDKVKRNQAVYDKKKKICKKSYEIQREFYNECNDKWLNPTTSAPLGIYEDNGILYTVFTYRAGECYYTCPSENETLRDILNIIIQLAQVVNKYHQKGFRCFDIKEKNVFVVGADEGRNIMLFDFNSFVPTEDLKNFKLGSRYDEITIESTTDPKEVLLPQELRAIINKIRSDSMIRISDTVDDETIVSMVNDLGEYGDLTDMFLIGSLLFKRVFGYTPDESLIKSDDDMWELPESTKVTTEACRSLLKSILSKAMAPDLGNRYEYMDDFIRKLKELNTIAHYEIEEDNIIHANQGIDQRYLGTSMGALSMCSESYWKYLGDDNAKFAQLKKLSGRFDSRVRLKDIENQSLSPIEVFRNNDTIFLQGDGGMGKSTALYDYWSDMLYGVGVKKKICFYVDLSLYEKIKEDEETGTWHTNFILRYIVNNIFHRSSCRTLSQVMERTGDDEKFTLADQAESIEKNQFRKNTDNPEYILFLDGYNEILQNSDKDTFATELKYILGINNKNDRWCNVQVVVTGRVLPKESEALYNIMSEFKVFSFIGVQDDDITTALSNTGSYSFEEIQRMRKDRLWEVLHVPMFLGLFISLDPDNTRELHTRGEILHTLINTHEPETAGRISESVGKDTEYKNYREFIVSYCLPFAANKMDQQREFYLQACSDFFDDEPDDSWDSCLTKGFDLYKKLLYKSNIQSPACLSCCKLNDEYDEYNRRVNLLLNDTGYCIKTADNRIGFSHQYFRDYFAARYIYNLLTTLQHTNGSDGRKLDFILANGLNYIWSQEVCELLGEITGDYKNVPNKE